MSQTEALADNVAVQNVPILKSKKSRILAFDLARGIAIIVMVLIHAIIFLGDPDLETTVWAYIANTIIPLFAAPVFTFIMGIMIAFSSKNSTKQLLYRGLIILGLGYVLNFLRGTVPNGIAEMFGWIDSPEVSAWVYMLEVDILQCAGLTFLIIALLKRFIPWNIGLAITGVAVIFISPLLWEISSESQPIGYVLSLFFGGNDYNFFPVFPWIAFPLIGMYYSSILKASKDIQRFFNTSLYIGLVIIIAGFVALYFDTGNILERWPQGYFLQGELPPIISIIFLGFICVWLSVCHLVTKHIQESWLIKAIYFWSRNVTVFYVLQWIVIGWLCVILPYLSWSAIIITVVAIHVVVDRLSHLWLKSGTGLVK